MSPNDLEEVMESGDIRKVYGVVVSKEDYLEHKEGKKFDSKEFDKHPHRYVSTFAEKVQNIINLYVIPSACIYVITECIMYT